MKTLEDYKNKQMPQHLPPFLPGETYHVYNHANGDDNIFREEDNYRYFMEKYMKYMAPMVDTLAYCWMKNHFHLMVRVKDVKTSKVFDLGGLDVEEQKKRISKKVSQGFSNFFNAYTKAFNKKYGRMGSLFAPNVKRKQITNDAYITQCIIYIHQNPERHGFVDDFQDWVHSSYQGIMDGNDPVAKSIKVLNWFGGPGSYIAAHRKPARQVSVFE